MTGKEWRSAVMSITVKKQQKNFKYLFCGTEWLMSLSFNLALVFFKICSNDDP